MANDPTALACTAYAAYGESTGNRNFRGDPMPRWEDLGEPIQTAWVAAATAVARAVEQEA
ncbi:hypothetical protein [Streptomyces tendae]|uniref:hypothetical protein n=1 Tax=Streptomyces tendae TaxID=1932 RepID=UPI00341B1DBD